MNPRAPGRAYGYVDMGGWVGGQAEYVMVPYADFNLLKFPNKEQAMAKIRDLTLLSDILPTGYHGAVTAGVGPAPPCTSPAPGRWAWPRRRRAQLLGAAVVMVGDMNPERLAQAKASASSRSTCRKSDGSAEQIEQILGVPEVDAAIDAVGFEARGHGTARRARAPATVLNSLMDDHPRRRRDRHPGPVRHRRSGRRRTRRPSWARCSIRIGLGWAKSHRFTPARCPVLRYNRQLMQAILHDRGADREDRERDGDHAGSGAAGLRGVRQGRGEEVRASTRTAPSRPPHRTAGRRCVYERPRCRFDTIAFALGNWTCAFQTVHLARMPRSDGREVPNSAKTTRLRLLTLYLLSGVASMGTM